MSGKSKLLFYAVDELFALDKKPAFMMCKSRFSYALCQSHLKNSHYERDLWVIEG
jgi:hypothetical protein